MNKWVLGARPRTLPAAIAPVVVGSALAAADFNLLRAFLALQVGLWMQIGVNFANDYSDGVKGTDQHRIGPTRLVAGGLASAKSVKGAAYLSFVIASIAGAWLALLTSPLLIAVGITAIVAAWGYTGGKNPYGYRGFGELSVFVFFGLVATMGTYYVQTTKITVLSFIVAVPMGALSCAILAVNNIRDRGQDELVGKKTVAVRLGDTNARREFVAFVIVAHVGALVTMKPWALLTLAVLPLSISTSKLVLGGVSGKDLITILGRTGKLQLIFATLFALGLAIH